MIYKKTIEYPPLRLSGLQILLSHGKRLFFRVKKFYMQFQTFMPNLIYIRSAVLEF